jgi:subtilisin-like proprotein convertase family protein
MKANRTLAALVALVWWCGQLEGEEIFTFSDLNKSIPDGQPAGISDFQTITSGIAQIGSLKVKLYVSGNFNGDLYCYLGHGTGYSVLLNRPGRTTGNLDGYDDGGFQITLSDTAANGDIHDYRGLQTPLPGFPLTGVWQPDARNISPDTVLDTDPRTAWLSSFGGLDPNGTWTLFIADLSSGGTSVLNGWQLEITAIPEPSGTAFALLAGFLVALKTRWRWRNGAWHVTSNTHQLY